MLCSIVDGDDETMMTISWVGGWKMFIFLEKLRGFRLGFEWKEGYLDGRRAGAGRERDVEGGAEGGVGYRFLQTGRERVGRERRDSDNGGWLDGFCVRFLAADLGDSGQRSGGLGCMRIGLCEGSSRGRIRGWRERGTSKVDSRRRDGQGAACCGGRRWERRSLMVGSV